MVANILPTNPLPPPLDPGNVVNRSNSTFSEHGHVAYQIKGNHEMQQHGTNILPAHPTHPPNLKHH